MKTSQKKNRVALWCSLPFVLVGLIAVVLLLPAELDEFYWSKKSACLCDTSGSFLRFRENRLVVYNTHHKIADFSGRFEKRENGQIDVFEQNSLEKPEERTMIIYPRLLGCWINYCGSGSSEWCWRGRRQDEIDAAIKSISVVSYQYDDEDFVRTHYDDQFNIVNVEREPRKKPRR